MTIIEKIANDEEIYKMNLKIAEKTGQMIPYHYKNYTSFKQYKDAVVKKYHEVLENGTP